MPYLALVSYDLHGASLGLVAEPWGLTTHAVRLTTVFLCDNILLLIQAQASYVAGLPRLRLVTSQGSPYPSRSPRVIASVLQTARSFYNPQPWQLVCATSTATSAQKY